MNATLSLLLFFAPLSYAAETTTVDYDASAKSARETLAQFVAADTTNPPGNEARVVKIIAARLDTAGIPHEITEFAPGRQNILARLKAVEPITGKPILLLAHSDVVTAAGQTWSTDPHLLTEKGKYLIGRGVSDDLGMAVVNLEAFLLLKKSGVALHRDVIFAVTGDEESNGTGIQYILDHKPLSLDAGIAFNEGGGITLDESGKPSFISIQSAEKTYQDFEIVAKSEPGHSSVPLNDNSIYRLSHALSRLEAYHEPARLIPVVRAYFEGRAALEKPELAAAMRALAHSKGPKLPAAALAVIEQVPQLRIQLRTTCVATTLKGGTRVNALPATAVANVNCRIMPDETVARVQLKLTSIFDDHKIEVRALPDSGQSEASPVEGEGPAAITQVAQKMWPGLPVFPFMEAGASDSRFLRQKGIAAYGVSPLPAYESDELHVHGVDERVPTASYRQGVEFTHRLMLELAGGKKTATPAAARGGSSHRLASTKETSHVRAENRH